MTDGSQRAIVAAFVANLGIAVAKFVGFAFTGAASMLAEAVHSVADTSNQGLLLLGGRRARRPATEEHPFGFGRERYFWSFVVAVVLFTAGALFALFEGEEKLRHPHELESAGWAVGILLVAIVLESFSLRTAVKESAHVKGDLVGKITVDPDAGTADTAALIDRAEAAVRATVPEARLIFLEPDVERSGQ